ncbi:putative glutathione-specific gamma-glutamylcyclotransferase 2 [Anopheles funestus]|uniref:glutathione-specific gamma-glutamylcyclotransferase n=1 Tax=Anopheles funestus TaxID=62324 RepID=A0A182RH12_ANOFN|nr:putative glutathione-specific gamma-glutamylcyclotransferase 2 [Anopheles funestus]
MSEAAHGTSSLKRMTNAKNGEGDNQNDIWIFGYGSLVWKADFPFEEKRTGYIKGFLRRFFQNSIDHRGTQERPGRVVTLIHSEEPESKVWGMGYRIGAKDKQQVLNHLDHREKNGYERHSVKFYPYPWSTEQLNDPQSILLYVATQDNPSFAGQSDTLDAIAEQIITSVGQSGRNPEYVYKLAEAMRQLYPGERDDHLFELEKLLLKRDPLANVPRKPDLALEGDVNRSELSKEG